MTSGESVEWERKHTLTFETECSPIERTLEDDPHVIFIGAVARCCLESGKPRDDVSLADAVNWLARHSHPLGSCNQGDEE